LTINTLGRLMEPEQFEAIIIKAGQENPQAMTTEADSTSPGTCARYCSSHSG
jgi:hypothetical protein